MSHPDPKHPELHTTECQENYKRIAEAKLEFQNHWPNYCQSCDAAGGKNYGGSYYEPPSFDECPKCLCNGLCPRCGQPAFDVDSDNWDHPCAHCSWNWGNSPSDILPEWDCWGCAYEKLTIE